MQICITTSTSAGLEQILPWMFYHKVIGVSTFFLFVEGKAASPNVSKVLESIPVSWHPLFSLFLFVREKFLFLFYFYFYFYCKLWYSTRCLMIWIPTSLSFMFLFQGVKVIFRTKELEEQQAKRLVNLTTIMGGKYVLNFELRMNSFFSPAQLFLWLLVLLAVLGPIGQKR